MLLGGSAGVLVGSLVDAREVDEDDSVLPTSQRRFRAIKPRSSQNWSSATQRSSTRTCQTSAGRVLRRPVDEVSAEVAVADKAQRKAEKVVREQMLKDRLEMRNHEVHAKVEEMKTRLNVPKATAGSSGSSSR